MTAPEWNEILPSPPPGARLHEMWMTTFEQPDAGLMVEHFLPSLLGASHSITQELRERTLFFGELGTALEALRGRLTVISSPSREIREISQYPWLWRYVSHFMVGAKSRAVQHAKLWAFHWKVGDEDLLELHVSSTNLTTSAFKAQLQAGWQVKLPLGTRTTVKAEKSWGELVRFLVKLGHSAGAVAVPRIQRLVTLLGRVECPADVTFIASIPGDKSKSALRQIKKFGPSKLHVLTPTIGEWKEQDLTAWSNDIGISSDNIHLKWISTQHPWAGSSCWTLSTSARETLEKKGTQIEHLSRETRLTKNHCDADRRWGHAKLYLFRNRKKRWLLVTSANWSPSAWGAGKTPPRNFELGVLFKSTWTDLEEIKERFSPPDIVPFCVDRADEEEGTSALQWAEASWDGVRIQLIARSSLDPSTPITAIITFNDRAEDLALVEDDEPGNFVAIMPWTENVCTPISARFSQSDNTFEVDVIDLRPPVKFAETPLPEVDPALAVALRDAFLLQRYGGPVVNEPPGGNEPCKRSHSDVAPPAVADYSVQAWLEVRTAFNVVDQWRAALDKAKTDHVLLDGEELRALYERRKGAGAALAAEELSWRLEDT